MTQNQLDADARSLLVAERETIVEVFNREGVAGAAALIEAELRIPGPLATLITGPSRAPGGQASKPIAGDLPGWPAGLATDDGFHRLELLRVGRTTAEPFLVTTKQLSGGYRLLVGRSLEEQQRLTATLTTSLVAAIGIALALALAISFLLTRTIGSRVQEIADVAGAVSGGDLSRRVDLPALGRGDAFYSLGIALNAMLARIEALLDELRSITDGLAHDLRSPLTRMKARIDRLAISGGDDAAIAAIGVEADALLAMLDISLEISRLEAGIGRDGFRRIDLAELINDMAEMYGPLAEDNGVALTARSDGPVEIMANRQLLLRALANLVDNALRHAPGGGEIMLEAAASSDGARLSVADRGPGIADAMRPEALRRFGRLDAARSKSGAGLGLSLAAAIARLHGGTLTLTGNNPGLRVEIAIPAN
ncbi:two-component sensor histidine kinase [Polymorphobacter glacialis]|uniref:histidine kinase n=1 Tax=Sandarakinorhabdus glacialis TaxID=1614636 RepID=A0A916ZN99_9SPHN|nr:HAMP domain-containing sensor histidine kinase [Polymorphobacter glacialis]GGE05917.1 two-component sensor histidine kinase [Polymorphobacter glacialis]